MQSRHRALHAYALLLTAYGGGDLEPRFLLLRLCKTIGDGARFGELLSEMTEARESTSIVDRMLLAGTLLEPGERGAREPVFRSILACGAEHAPARAGLERAIGIVVEDDR